MEKYFIGSKKRDFKDDYHNYGIIFKQQEDGRYKGINFFNDLYLTEEEIKRDLELNYLKVYNKDGK